MPSTVLSFDVGSTVLKAGLFDRSSGALLGVESTRLTTATDATGKREQSPHEIIHGLSSVIEAFKQTHSGAFARLGGVAVAGQGGSACLVHRTTGEAFTPLYVWNDARTFPRHETVCQLMPVSFWRSFTWRDEPGVGLARVAWLRNQYPQHFNCDTILAGAADFVFFHLTGVWRQDACHALQNGCYDVTRDQLSALGPALINETLERYPALRRGHELATTVEGSAALGIPAGIPVAGPYMDHEAAYLAAAASSNTPLLASLGTAWVGTFSTATAVPDGSPFQLVMGNPASAGHLVIQPLLTGNVSWDWALTTFLDPEIATAIAAADALFAAKPFPNPGQVILPWLNRPNLMQRDLLGGGVYFGISPATDKGEIVRTLAFSLVAEFRRVFEQVTTNGAAKSLLLFGGTSRSLHFQQLMAASFPEVPVLCVTEADTLGLRGAMTAFGSQLAAVAVRQVPAPDKTFRDAMASRQMLYQQVYNTLGHLEPVGKAYTL
ncbi:MAG: FGGY family carbohydrate kinase [Verrucomicrobiota bacterium]|nr:FGGY family carbohydrate kinase [Verrucomicrobiota bacterium]